MSDNTNPGINEIPPTNPAPASTASSSTGHSPGGSTKDVAADEARSVAADSQSSADQVAETAKQQAGDVIDEARTQAREVYAQAKQELAGHATEQHRRAGSGLHALADELHGMVEGSPQGGLATDLAHEAAGRVSALAGWFDGHEPGDALEELRNVARRRPGAFLAGAAILGLVAGRLTRGGVDEARDDGPDNDSRDDAPYRTEPAYPGESERVSAPLPVANGVGYAAEEAAVDDVDVVPADPYDNAVTSGQVRPS